MTESPRFAIFGNVYQPKKSVGLQHLLTELRRRGAVVLMEREFMDFVCEGQGLSASGVQPFSGSDFEADFVISMGGDGTFLRSAHYVGGRHIPVMGVNMGRLGFLADVSPDAVADAVGALYRGDYVLESHAVIQVETEGQALQTCPRALNEIAVLKRDNASMISIHTEVNGEHLVTYQADGLIVSTPTGSTAYSLSNGGPIMVPQTGTLCLTAVAPHSLNLRPIVLKDDCRVVLTVESRSHQFLIAVDGRSEKMDEGTRLVITRAPYGIPIVRRHGQSYFATLREKMAWGLDNR